MPYIAFESGTLAPEVRDELIQQLTDVAATVTGIPKHLFLVAVRELPDDNIAVGGTTVRQLKHNSGR